MERWMNDMEGLTWRCSYVKEEEYFLQKNNESTTWFTVVQKAFLVE